MQNIKSVRLKKLDIENKGIEMHYIYFTAFGILIQTLLWYS